MVEGTENSLVSSEPPPAVRLRADGKFLKVLLSFEAITAILLLATILCGQIKLAPSQLLAQAGIVAGLFGARFALAIAKEDFRGKMRAAIVIAEFAPTFLLPRFGSIDPAAMPIILTTLQLRNTPTKDSTALFFGILAVVLRECIFVGSVTNYSSIAAFCLSSLILAVPLVLSIRIVASLEKTASPIPSAADKAGSVGEMFDMEQAAHQPATNQLLDVASSPTLDVSAGERAILVAKGVQQPGETPAARTNSLIILTKLTTLQKELAALKSLNDHNAPERIEVMNTCHNLIQSIRFELAQNRSSNDEHTAHG